MKLVGYKDRIVEYYCNICGQRNSERADRFHRELTACISCGSNPRFRGLMHVLCCEIFGQPLVLDDAPSNLPITGVGFGDSGIYAQKLTRIFAYQNTYLDQQPQLDISNPASSQRYLPVDFVVCSEIFEHLAPPLQKAFANLRALLRPGGLLVFSVPTTAAAETVEHFPNFHSAHIIKFDDEHVLVNRSEDGQLEIFRHRPGTVLEMRVFSESHLVRYLHDASFTDVRIYSDPIPEIGYLWGEIPLAMGHIGNLLRYVLTARAAQVNNRRLPVTAL